jgi:hypothetical protein
MENLVGLLVVVVGFIVWIAQSVAQAKKQSSQEFDEALSELEEAEEKGVLPNTEAPLPSPPPKQQLPQGAPTWKQLQQQLQQMLEPAPSNRPKSAEEPLPQRERPIPPLAQAPQPPRRLQPAPGKPFPPIQPRPGAQPMKPVRRIPKQFPQPVASASAPRKQAEAPSVAQRERPSGPVTAVGRTAAAMKARPAAEVAQPVARTQKIRRGFPTIHPDPLVNAFLMAEVFKPYPRGSATPRRGFGGA